MEAVRLLTDEDFENIDRLRELEAEKQLDKQLAKRVRLEEIDEDEFQITETVDAKTIWGTQKSRKVGLH